MYCPVKNSNELFNKHSGLVYTLHRDVFTGQFYATLLRGEFANCYGQGSTAEDALRSLRLTVNYWRNKNKKTNYVLETEKRRVY
jgi:hypothetical protein